MLAARRFAPLTLLFSMLLVVSTQAAPDERPSAQAWAQRSLLGRAVDQPASVLNGQRPPFSFVYGGASSLKFLPSWKMSVADSPAAEGQQRHTVTYTDPATGLQVVCEATVFGDFPAVEWVLHFRNQGQADTPTIEAVRPLDLAIAVPPSGPIVFHHCQGSTCSQTDFLPFDDPVAPNANIHLTPSGGRSSDGNLPFFNVQWQGGGVVAAVGWSGQWAMDLRRPAAGELNFQAGQETTHLKLHPGESIRTPRMLLVLWQGDDAMRGHNLFRRLLVAHYLPKRNGEVVPAPVTWNSWFSFNEGNGVNEANQFDWIARTAKTGTECYWLDAGWFEGGWPNGAGSWVPGAKQFPRGLRPVGDAAHKAGMKFVLWFEPERVTPISRIAKEHPEWVLHAGAGDGLLDLGKPAARRWLTDYLSKCFKDWGVDVFRNDFNIDPLRFWRAADAPDRQGMSEIRYVEGFYEFWDELVRRQPQLTIDNCASGGRRIDLETTSRSYPLWRSDSPCVGTGANAWTTTDQIETAGLMLYVPQHTEGVWAFTPYVFRSAATMGASLSMDARDKDCPLEMAQRAIAEVKELRPLYLGDYYPLLPINSDDHAWCGWQFDRPELGRGFAMFFRRPHSPYASVELALHGLDPQSQYELEFRESYAVKAKRTMSGSQLAKLRVDIGAAPGSMLVTYRKIEPAK